MADSNQAPAPEEKKAPSKIMRDAMDAFGLRPSHILASKDYGDHVVMVTMGGKKLSFAPGDKVKELDEVHKNGQPAKKKK